jgi:hypothetical protein
MSSRASEGEGEKVPTSPSNRPPTLKPVTTMTEVSWLQ